MAELPNIEKLNNLNWTSLSLKTPVVFRLEEKQFIIRYMKNVKGNIMVELSMDDDKLMKNLISLPEHVQVLIDKHIKLQAA